MVEFQPIWHRNLSKNLMCEMIMFYRYQIEKTKLNLRSLSFGTELVLAVK